MSTTEYVSINEVNVCIHFIFIFRYSSEYTVIELTYNGLNILAPSSFKIMLVFCFVSFFTLQVVLYCCIFRTAKHHAARINALESITSTNSTERAISKTDIKIAKMMVTVFGLFYLTYLPSIVLVGIRWCFSSLKKNMTFRIIISFTSRMIVINSAINPITYAFKDRRFREVFKSVLRRVHTEPIVELSKTSYGEKKKTENRVVYLINEYISDKRISS